MISAYPLTWPHQVPRITRREAGRFKTPLKTALGNVRTSLTLFGKESGKPVANLVISSNVTLGEELPQDPGVAIWFTWDGMQVCVAVDRYTSVQANLQAIHHIVEARRTEVRHGTLAMVRATFTGFLALTYSGASKRHWREVLGLGAGPVSADAIKAAHQRLARTLHPDVGGSVEAMAELNTARDEALLQATGAPT